MTTALTIPHSWGSVPDFREFNQCHLPSGSDEGGQFGAKGKCGPGGDTDGREDALGRWLDANGLPPAVRNAVLTGAALSYHHPFTKEYGPRETFWLVAGGEAQPAVVRENVAQWADYRRMIDFGEAPSPHPDAPVDVSKQFVEDVIAAGGVPGSTNGVNLDVLLPGRDVSKIRESWISVHTHPSDHGPFSGDDLTAFLKSHSSMYVVTQSGEWFHLQKNPGGTALSDLARLELRASYTGHLARASAADTPKVVALLNEMGSPPTPSGLKQRAFAALAGRPSFDTMAAAISRLTPAQKKRVDDQWAQTQLTAWAGFAREHRRVFRFRRGRIALSKNPS